MDTTIMDKTAQTRSASAAVLSMALCVAVLIASEFLPVSLLTPIAQDLGLSEGAAGQAISISGLFAVIQLAIMSGAALGGLIFDGFGWQANFAMSALLLLGASIAASLTWKNLEAVK